MNYKEILLPATIFLIGFVMLMAGKGGARLGGRILLVILGWIALFLVFGYVVSRAL
ncbi:MAG: hypothetical protein M3280_01000 [Actinomycetota bacterium]|nr:hypothetical protein [Actinomycetota bacterium]